jgi:hypothetical protein
MQNTIAKEKHKFAKELAWAVGAVTKFRIKGVRVRATRIKITATTVDVKSFFRWANSPVILTAAKIRPPKRIEE